MKEQITQLKKKMQMILNKSKNKSITIGLLKSLKEQLTLKLEVRNKEKILGEIAKSLQKTNTMSTQLSGKANEEKDFLRSFFLKNEQIIFRELTAALIQIYRQRTSANSLQYQLQQKFNSLENHHNMVSKQSESNSFQIKHRVIESLNQILLQLKRLLSQVQSIYSIIQDFLKVLRVKYLQVKSKRKLKSKKRCYQDKDKQSIITFPNDENRNQVLVNL